MHGAFVIMGFGNGPTTYYKLLLLTYLIDNKSICNKAVRLENKGLLNSTGFLRFLEPVSRVGRGVGEKCDALFRFGQCPV
jgi:hypothetical protein